MALDWKEQYRHPNWQKKRLQAMEAAEFHCQRCFDGETTLNVHHKFYVKGRMVWEYELHELQVLCEPCHEVQHQVNDRIKQALAKFWPDHVDDAAELVELLTEGRGPEGFDTHLILAMYAGLQAAAGHGSPDRHDAIRDRNPIAFHYGLMAGIVMFGQHVDGQGSRDMEFLKGERAPEGAWDHLAVTLPIICAMDSIPVEDRGPGRWLLAHTAEKIARKG